MIVLSMNFWNKGYHIICPIIWTVNKKGDENMKEFFQREREISEIASKYVNIAHESNLTISEFLASLKYAESKVMNGSYVSDSKLSSS